MRNNFILLLVLIHFSGYSQTSTELNSISFSIDKNKIANELSVANIDFLHQKVAQAFINYGATMDNNSFFEVVPKLIITSITNDGIDTNIMCRLDLTIYNKKNASIITSFQKSITGYGNSKENAISNVINTIDSLNSDEEFNTFILTLRNKINEYKSLKTHNISSKNQEVRNDTIIVHTNPPKEEKPISSTNIFIKIFQTSKNWLSEFLSDIDNLFGIIGALAAFYYFVVKLRNRKKSTKKQK